MFAGFIESSGIHQQKARSPLWFESSHLEEEELDPESVFWAGFFLNWVCFPLALASWEDLVLDLVSTPFFSAPS